MDCADMKGYIVLSQFGDAPFFLPKGPFTKGLQRQRLIGSAVAGFINARTITKAFATDLDTRQDDNNKGIYSPWELSQ